MRKRGGGGGVGGGKIGERCGRWFKQNVAQPVSPSIQHNCAAQGRLCDSGDRRSPQCRGWRGFPAAGGSGGAAALFTAPPVRGDHWSTGGGLTGGLGERSPPEFFCGFAHGDFSCSLLFLLFPLSFSFPFPPSFC
jgi:hypothetical protein